MTFRTLWNQPEPPHPLLRLILTSVTAIWSQVKTPAVPEVCQCCGTMLHACFLLQGCIKGINLDLLAESVHGGGSPSQSRFSYYWLVLLNTYFRFLHFNLLCNGYSPFPRPAALPSAALLCYHSKYVHA